MKIKVAVKPSSGKQEITKIQDNNYKAYLKSQPENNKANIELLKLIKKHFKQDNITKIKIIKGRTSKNKTLEII